MLIAFKTSHLIWVQRKFVLPIWLLYSLSMDLLLELKKKNIFFGQPSAIDDGGVCRRCLLGSFELKKVHNFNLFSKVSMVFLEL